MKWFFRDLEKYRSPTYCISPYKLKIFLNLANGCNFGCKGCTHFSPLVDKEDKYVSIKEFKHNIDLIVKSFKLQRIASVHLLGGEPLLNPNIEELLIYTRTQVPYQCIEILSNGFLFKTLPDSFFETCKQYNIDLAISKYNINFDYKSIQNRINSFGIKPRITAVPYSMNLLLNKTARPTNNFLNCGANLVTTIIDGKLYPCATAGKIKYFNKYFNQQLGEPIKYIDIDKHNYYEIYDSLWDPPTLCDYCFGKGQAETSWTTTKKNIYEWVAQDF